MKLNFIYFTGKLKKNGLKAQKSEVEKLSLVLLKSIIITKLQ